MLVETCGGTLEIPYGTLRVDFEQITLRRDGENRWRAILPVVSSGRLKALLGYGKSPGAALVSLLERVTEHGAKARYE